MYLTIRQHYFNGHKHLSYYKPEDDQKSGYNVQNEYGADVYNRLTKIEINKFVNSTE